MLLVRNRHSGKARQLTEPVSSLLERQSKSASATQKPLRRPAYCSRVVAPNRFDQQSHPNRFAVYLEETRRVARARAPLADCRTQPYTSGKQDSQSAETL